MYTAHPDARPLEVCLPLKVQTYDIDYAGHVNNIVYVRWLEDLRMEMLHRYYTVARMLTENTGFILHNTTITYQSSIRLDESPEGRMWCVKVGRATMTVHAEFRVADRICATASQRGILLKQGTTKAARLPEDLLEAFQAQNIKKSSKSA